MGKGLKEKGQCGGVKDDGLVFSLGSWVGGFVKIGSESVLGRRDKLGLCSHCRSPLPCSPLSHSSPSHLSDPPRGTSAFLSFPLSHPHQEGPCNDHGCPCPQRRTSRWLYADPEVPARKGASGGWGRGAAGDQEQAAAVPEPCRLCPSSAIEAQPCLLGVGGLPALCPHSLQASSEGRAVGHS